MPEKTTIINLGFWNYALDPSNTYFIVFTHNIFTGGPGIKSIKSAFLQTETNKVLTMAYVTTNNQIVIRKVNINIKDAFKNYIETLKQIEISSDDKIAVDLGNKDLNSAPKEIKRIRWIGNWLILFVNFKETNTNFVYKYYFSSNDIKKVEGFITPSIDLLSISSVKDLIIYESAMFKDATPYILAEETNPGEPVSLNLYKISSFVNFKNQRECFLTTKPKPNGTLTPGDGNLESSYICSVSCDRNQYMVPSQSMCKDCDIQKYGTNIRQYVFNNKCILSNSKESTCKNINLFGHCQDEVVITGGSQLTTNGNNFHCRAGFSSINGNCVSCKSIGKFYMIDTCENQCRIGYHADSENICHPVNCPSDTTIDLISNSCLKCPPTKPIFDLISNSCVSMCSEETKKVSINYSLSYDYCACISGEILIDPSKSKCINKESCIHENGQITEFTSGLKACANTANNLIAFNNSCSEGKWFNTNTRSCEECNLDNNYSYNGKCYTECPLNTIPYGKTCKECPVDSPYVLSNSCVSSCPSDHVLLKNEKHCIKKYICPKAGSYYDSTTSSCIACSSGTYLLNENDNQACVSACPTKHEIKNRTCIPCSSEQYYNANTRACVSKCDSLFSVDEHAKVCHNCSMAGLFWDPVSHLCVERCPENTVDNLDFGCMPEGKVILNGQIVEKCPDKYTLNANTRVCEYCDMFMDNGKCTNICGKNRIPFDKNISFKGSLIEILRTQIEIDHNTCFDCYMYGKIKYQSGCIDRCHTDGLSYSIDKPSSIAVLDFASNTCKIESKLISDSCKCKGANSTCLNTKTDNTFCSKCKCDEGTYGLECQFNKQQKDEMISELDIKISEIEDSLTKSNDAVGEKSGDFIVKVKECVDVLTLFPEVINQRRRVLTDLKDFISEIMAVEEGNKSKEILEAQNMVNILYSLE